MDKKADQFAIGYLRLPDIGNELEIQKKISALREHCEANQMKLVLVLSEPERGSENFKGSGWRDLQNTLHYAEGRIQFLVIPDKNMLTKDVGLYLLKEKELRDTLAIKIEIADGQSRKKDKSQDLSLN